MFIINIVIIITIIVIIISCSFKPYNCKETSYNITNKQLYIYI